MPPPNHRAKYLHRKLLIIKSFCIFTIHRVILTDLFQITSSVVDKQVTCGANANLMPRFSQLIKDFDKALSKPRHQAHFAVNLLSISPQGASEHSVRSRWYSHLGEKLCGHRGTRLEMNLHSLHRSQRGAYPPALESRYRARRSASPL